MVNNSVCFLGGASQGSDRQSHEAISQSICVCQNGYQSQSNTRSAFSDMVYFQACVLDPSFGLKWVDHNVMAGDIEKEKVKRAIRDSVLAINMDDQTVAQNTLSEVGQPPPNKARRLFAYQSTSSQPRSRTMSLAAEYTMYLDIIESQECDKDCLKCWATKSQTNFQSCFQLYNQY